MSRKLDTFTVKEIVKVWLKGGKFDGLCNEDCGCGFDDFMPCSGYGQIESCLPAYARAPTDEEKEIHGAPVTFTNIKPVM